MESPTKVPIWVKILAWPIQILETEGNVADGHIERFSFMKREQSIHRYRYKDQITTSRDGYSSIWSYVTGDWFKEIGKWSEGPWSCQ